MSVVFSTDNMGRAVSLKVKGASPLISLDVDPGLRDTSIYDVVAGQPGSSGFSFGPFGPVLMGAGVSPRDVSEGAAWVVDRAGTFWQETVGNFLNAGDTKTRISPNRQLTTNLSQRHWFIKRLNRARTDKLDPATISYYRQILRNTSRAEMSLTQALSGIGIITNMSCSFEDAAQPEGKQIPEPTGKLGTATIGGLVFERSCLSDADRAEGGGVSEGRHGLERLLEYYYWQRVSNRQSGKPVSTMSFTIGKTKLQGWVVGFSFQPVKPEYRLWGWNIYMAVMPDYWVESVGLGGKT